jgi:hypothetical protein
MRALLGVVITVQVLAADAPAVQLRSLGAQQPETYESATIDANGNLTIVKSNGQSVVIRKEAEQTAFSAPVMAPAKTAVGAQAMFANCCTSYDIPLQLVVYSGGTVHRFKGVGLPIFKWGFAHQGTRVAYGQEPVHFGCATHYELREIDSEHLVESIDLPEPCGQFPNPQPVPMPQWLTDLLAKK